MGPQRHILIAIALLLVVIVVGTVGYNIIEGWSYLDSIYMTITTITTVGYKEVHDLSDNGRIFSIILMVFGVGGAIYTITSIARFVLEGHIGGAFRRRQMKERLENLRNHVILCGYGRVGSEVARFLVEENASFVIVEDKIQAVEQAEKDGYIVIKGDATIDSVLAEAGINRAKALIAAMGTAAENTYVTLSARSMRPDIFIVARSDMPDSEPKLEKAGANRVVSPSKIGARRLAVLSLRPLVADMLDTLVSHGVEFRLEELNVDPNSTLAGNTIEQCRDQVSGCSILAVRKADGNLIPNPSGETIIESQDKLVVIGTKQQLQVLEDRAGAEIS